MSRTGLALVSLLAASLCSAKDLTYYKDVAPIVQNRCLECHRPGEAAPMSFTSYKEVRPWAKAMKAAVLSKKMPPWFAEDPHGKFSNDRRLSEEEIKTLTAWVDAGAKEGDVKDAPKPVKYETGWTIGKPDVVLEMPNEVKIPADGKIEYTYIVVPTKFAEDKWVEKVELRPGNRSVVHHIVLYARAPGSKFLQGAQPGIPFIPKEPDTKAEHKPDTGMGAFYALGNETLEMASVYVPGGLAYTTLPGQARLIRAGSDLIFQMHYTANGKETTDKSQVGIVFAKEKPKERVINTFVLNPNMHIPPMAANHAIKATVTVHEQVKLQSMFPHMHVRGKAMEYKAIYPTGETQTLLNVPHYDFNWQLTYLLKDPIVLPKGSKLEITGWYDNSPNNPNNPDPKQDVYWGEQTWEEMLAAFIDFAIPVDMKPVDIARPKKPAAPSAGGGE